MVRGNNLDKHIAGGSLGPMTVINLIRTLNLSALFVAGKQSVCLPGCTISDGL